MLVLDATLLIVLKLGSRARNEFEYLGQPSRFIHLFDADAVATAFLMVRKMILPVLLKLV